ncbi:MAG: translocation/assembly module TamB [Candidatus Omnitrophica bacterium]|nr:translocation/assembly module TamB [Candidatus Omnitrophota bacterium]
MMNNNKKIILMFFYAILSSTALILILIYFFLFTEKGGAFLSQRFMRVMNNRNQISWQKNEGSLISGMVYKDIEFEDLKWFPAPNRLKIQSLAVDIDSFSLDGITLKIFNARFYLPDSEPIVFYGNFENKLLDFNVYIKAISDREIKSLVKTEILQGITGSLADIDVFIKGSIQEPVFTGKLVIEKLLKDAFLLEKAPCIFELKIKNVEDKLGLYGPFTLTGGTINGKKTALVQLQESKIIFNGDPGKPNFDIKGTSVVEKVRMTITLKGSFKEPNLQINSEPPMSKDRLLLALATNKTWQSTEELMSKGSISPNLAKDFMDYFIFGGQSSKFAEKFGIKDFSLKYDTQGNKGVTVTKDLSNRLEGKYEIEEKKQKEGAADVSQKVGGEYKVTDAVSLEAKKELKQKDTNTQQENKTTEGQVLLKFKKSF